MSRHSLGCTLRWLIFSAWFFGNAGTAFAVCLTPPGDLDNSASTNVGDVQCSILMNLWSLEGQINPVPTCVKIPGSPSIVADHNCDGVLNIADTLLAINFALKVALEPTLDGNANQCVDACETDSDGDGTFDLLDCAPLNPNISAAAIELCNGYDDDCDGLVDELTTPTTHGSCSDNTVCTGTELCEGLALGLPLMITEIMADPAAVTDANGEWFEIYNGTTTSININGWTIQTGQGQTHVIDAGGALFVPPSTAIVLGAQKSPATNGGVRVNYQYSGLTFDNASDSVILKDLGGAEVDRVDFGGATGISIVTGASAALISPEFNNNVGASWATSTATFGVGDKGTPVSPNFDVMPGFCLPGTPLVCVDGNVCTDDGCDAITGCQFVNNTEPCDDTNPCTISDTCGGGSCAGTVIVCDDTNPCTNDSCVGGVCQFVNNTASCDDGDVCTLVDTCGGGTCNGAGAPNCDDGNVCTLDYCDQEHAEALPNGCMNDSEAQLGQACDDNSACTTPDLCDSDGNCVSGVLIVCDDSNPCTDDSCDPGSGCVFTANTAACEDGDLCTVSDVCAGSVCEPGMPIDCDDTNECTDDACVGGLCEYADNTQPCDDGDLCTDNDICGGGSCAGTDIVCDDNNVCTDDACVAGVCEFTNNTAPCDDTDACTENDTCDSGSCVGTEIVCDDTNECTDDACVAGLCEFTNNTTPCDDGDLCTENDICGGGSCAGTDIVCDDNNVCTDDACVAGVCEFTNNTAPCDDTDACTENDTCDGGSCVGTEIVCDDTNECTDDACVAGLCEFSDNTNPCDDSDLCTENDVCGGGSCAGTPIVCDDSDVCTDDACVAGVCEFTNNTAPCDDTDLCTENDTCDGGGCVGTEIVCDDTNECTDDACVAGLCEFTNNTIPCDDGDLCTESDTCDSGSCVGTEIVCDDTNECTDDACVAGLCEFTDNTIPCDDGDLCTESDVCGGGSCAGTPIVCDDTNECTDDACVAGLCEFADNTIPCDDGDLCTESDVCGGGSCAGTPIVCDDTNECTDDACVAGVCEFTNNIAPCDDTDACTENDVCGDGVCAGAPIDCDDNNVCTTDSCDAGICLNDFNTDPCDDGDVCTLTDTCEDGSCVGVGAPDCDDGNVCTADFCDQNNPDALPNGCVNDGFAQFGQICDDEDACTFPDACDFDGNCVSGFVIDCDDNNDCTADSCDIGTGCVFDGESLSGAACDDLNECTDSDTCDGSGGCVPGEPVECDDGNPCTDDVCNVLAGCVFTNNSDPCDDGDAFTTGDTCIDSICQGTGVNCDDGDPCTDDAYDPIEAACVYSQNTAVCDDGDPCTVNDVCAAGVCAGSPKDCSTNNPCLSGSCQPGTGFCVLLPDFSDPTCLPENAFCAVSGTAGDEVLCPILLARATFLTPLPAGAQWQINFDPATVGLVGYQDDICVGPGNCSTVDVPPGSLSTGHGLTLIPGDMPTWPGSGYTFALNAGNPTAGLSDAFLSGPNLVGLALIAELRVELLQTIDPATPVFLEYADVQGTTADALPMNGGVNAGVMVLELADCANVPESCEDGDPCTTNACDEGSGTCTSEPVDCSDGDACNGEEVCTYPAGCGPGVAPDCDDLSACTVDSCDPAIGCVNTAIDCDDGDLCNGIEDCDPATGCVAGTPVDCDDADPCTLDNCSSGLCEYLPSLDPSCFPADAFCVVVGTAGSTAVCELRIARATNTTPLPVGAQFTIGFDDGVVAVDGFEDEQCVGPGGTEPCFTVSVPPNPLFPSGHSVIIVPLSTGDWAGSGNVFLANLGDPTSPVSSAYLSGGTVSGDSLVMTMNVTLVVDVPAETPEYLYLSTVKGTTEDAQDLIGAVYPGGLMVLSWPDCSEIPGICDDENACTTDSCNGVSGACEYSAIVCDNSQACDGTETCDVSAGCQVGTPPDCDDGDPCTDDSCDDALGCVYTPVGCDDGDSCNGLETCEAGTGACLPGIDQDCDDNDDCTVDSCSSSACVYIPAADSACFPAGAFCMVVGTAGETATCALRLARESFNTPVPVGAQFTIDFDQAVLTADGFTDMVCTGPGNTPPCTPAAVPPAALSPSGHTAIPAPEDVADWAGTGHVFLLHLSDPTSPVSGAYVSGGTTSSDPLILTLNLSLVADIDSATPSYLYLSDVKATTQDADALDGVVQTGGLMVVSWPDCNEIGGICDDENVCTTDSCDVGGDCVFAPIDCDDGDACNGAETCDPGAGCVSPGLDCDDNDACTVDSCDSGTGCQYTPLVCDDDDACNGVESCDSGSGCVAGTPLVCDDENGCTVDSCVALSGCLFVDDLSPECLPDGALCKLTGIPGTSFVCDVRITREDDLVPLVVSAYFDLSYNGFAIQLITFEDEVCFGPGGGEPCTTFDVPPDVLDPSGHDVELAPPGPITGWGGSGSISIVHPTDGTMEINDSTWNGGAPVGDTLVMRLRGQLLTNIPDTSPITITVDNPYGEDEGGQLLPGTTVEGTMVITTGGD